MGVLSGFLILNCSDEKGALCIEILANMGAEVIRLNIESKAEQLHLYDLAKNADILIETHPLGYLPSLGLGYQDLTKINPRLIMASITHFGQSGPYHDYKSSDLVDQALGGWLSVTGEAKSPLKLSGNQAYHTAALFTVNGILLALWQRHAAGRGQYLDISIMECVAATLDHVLPRFFYAGIISGRQGSLHWNNAFRVFACQDGYILLSLHLHWETLVEWLASEGMADDLTDEKWRDRQARNRDIGHIIKVLEKWTLSHQVGELVEKGQLMHFPWAEVA